MILVKQGEVERAREHSWVEEGRAALALPTLGLIVGVLDARSVGGRGDLDGLAWLAASALVLAVGRPGPEPAQSPALLVPDLSHLLHARSLRKHNRKRETETPAKKIITDHAENVCRMDQPNPI